MSRPPGVLARPCPELLPRLGCSLTKTTPYFSCVGFWFFLVTHSKHPKNWEKEGFKVLVFILCLPLTGRSAQGPAVWVLPGWEWRLGPCLFCPVAAVTQPGEQCSPLPGGVKTGQLKVSGINIWIKNGWSGYHLHRPVCCLWHTSVLVWMTGKTASKVFGLMSGSKLLKIFSIPYISYCRNCRHVLFTVLFLSWAKLIGSWSGNCCFGRVMSTVWVRSQFLI